MQAVADQLDLDVLNPAFEKIILPYIKNLNALGIDASLRTIAVWSDNSGSSNNSGPAFSCSAHSSPIRRKVPSENCVSYWYAPKPRQCLNLLRK